MNKDIDKKNIDKKIVLFDGICNLCNGAVQFILKRDKKNRFLFGALQGNAGQQYIADFKLPAPSFHSFILVENGRVYTRSTAVLRVLKRLGGAWPLLYAFIIVPPFIRDGLYRLIAKNRYKWFGKKDQCRVPAPAEKEKFLE
ncbi:MAG: thiol-disulfide oxidoreductase DCC family protein [Bacteroidota bacterium]